MRRLRGSIFVRGGFLEESERDDGGDVNRAVRYHWVCGRCGHEEDSAVMAVRKSGKKNYYAYKTVVISGREDNERCPKCGCSNVDGWRVRDTESYEPDGMVVWCPTR